MADSIAVAFIAIFSLLAGFILNVVYENHKGREKTRKENLKTHFNDTKIHIIDKISEMSRSLAIRQERLVTSLSQVQEKYDFEQGDYYRSFEIHFPEEAKEWKELNNRAVELNEKLVNFFQDHQYHRGTSAQNVANNYIKDLQQDFGNFARRLADKVESVAKYQNTSVFTYNKKCPICRKF